MSIFYTWWVDDKALAVPMPGGERIGLEPMFPSQRSATELNPTVIPTDGNYRHQAI
jgi:hypothetical protein